MRQPLDESNPPHVGKEHSEIPEKKNLFNKGGEGEGERDGEGEREGGRGGEGERERAR